MENPYWEQREAYEAEAGAGEGGFRIPPLLLLAVHIPLALVLAQSSLISTLHAIAVFLIGLWFAVMGRRVEQVAYVAAYINGAEVLWRMTGAVVPWEFGKYGTAALFIISMARNSRLQGPMLPFLYFVLLLPSSALTLLAEPLGEARQQISFNLSGPFALMVCALFFSHLRLDAERLQWLRLAFVAPILSIAVIAVNSMLSNPELVFTGESNNATSGGYGPNQVSAALGLGAMLILFFLLEAQASVFIRVALFLTMLVLAGQSAMTFSRGGLYNAVGGIVVGFLFLARNVQAMMRIVLVAALLVGTATLYIIPQLDDFTGGALTRRFESTDPTNRDHIVSADLQIWGEHPLLGVGPGQGPNYRKLIYYGAVAHTEFSRLFAEHGFLGFLSLVLLFVTGLQAVLLSPGSQAKAAKASLLTWSVLYMLNAAMRLAAPSFLFGLTFAEFDLGEEDRAEAEDE
ncbi:MAG: O-antigen ligase family protein [Blastocatellia bacterium]